MSLREKLVMNIVRYLPVVYIRGTTSCIQFARSPYNSFVTFAPALFRNHFAPDTRSVTNYLCLRASLTHALSVLATVVEHVVVQAAVRDGIVLNNRICHKVYDEQLRRRKRRKYGTYRRERDGAIEKSVILECEVSQVKRSLSLR